MITGSFAGVTMKNVVGYKVAANWVPINGFQNYFFVYVWDMEDAQSKFDQAVDVGKDGAPKRDTLTLSGGSRTYNFKNIDLMSAQLGVTRRFRYRLLEFRYDKKMVSDGSTPITLKNDETKKLKDGNLKTDYQYSLGAGAENLLGFRSRLAATGGNVLRFSSLRNNQNCFFEKIIKANDERNTGTRMTEFTVSFNPSGAQNIVVNQDNLASVYVDESYGFLAGEQQPPLLDLVSGDSALVREAVSLKLEDFTQRQLINFDAKLDANPRETSSETVETATFVFNQGYYQELKIQ